MIRWIANVIFVIVAVALAIFFLRIQESDGTVSIRVRDAQEREALWQSIVGKKRPPAQGDPHDPSSPDMDSADKVTPKPDKVSPTQRTTPPAPSEKSEDKPTRKNTKPAEKDLDREGLDELIEKSL